MSRIAALQMYDLPEVAEATDAFWAALAGRLRRAGVEGVPDRLDHGSDPRAIWGSPRLLFSQTCGYPLTHEFDGRLALVATPCYAALGCAGPNYRSHFIVRADDRRASIGEFAGAVAAVNSEHSHSGFNILRWRVAREGRSPFFSRVERTGGHAPSIAAVRSGRADLASIDCVTFALLERHRPDSVAGVRVLEESPPSPGLPYVTAAGATERERVSLREALAETMADAALAEVREALLLRGVEQLPPERYEAIRDFAREGARVTLC
ncbi:MAG: PhnD/SsuA/transferrin family substrate-binding protein [Rhodospirillales bacterium]|nr:PhnD/SsuA/transferrin family substrate-binding protein [Rhodospirillales bacterium]